MHHSSTFLNVIISPPSPALQSFKTCPYKRAKKTNPETRFCPTTIVTCDGKGNRKIHDERKDGNLFTSGRMAAHICGTSLMRYDHVRLALSSVFEATWQCYLWIRNSTRSFPFRFFFLIFYFFLSVHSYLVDLRKLFVKKERKKREICKHVEGVCV